MKIDINPEPEMWRRERAGGNGGCLGAEIYCSNKGRCIRIVDDTGEEAPVSETYRVCDDDTPYLITEARMASFWEDAGYTSWDQVAIA